MTKEFAGVRFASLGVGLWLLGMFSLYRRDRCASALLAMPLVFVLLAAVLQKYPFKERLILFFVPFTILWICADLDYVWRGRYRVGGFVLTLAIAVLLLYPPGIRAARSLVGPPGREEIRPILEYISYHSQPGDPLYVYYGAQPAFKFYTEHAGLRTLSDLSPIMGVGRQSDPERYAADLQQLKDKRRVWSLSHTRAHLEGRTRRPSSGQSSIGTGKGWRKLKQEKPQSICMI